MSSSKNCSIWTWNPNRNHCGGRGLPRRTSPRSRWEEEGKNGGCHAGRSAWYWDIVFGVMGKSHKRSKRHFAKRWTAGGETLIYRSRSDSLTTKCQRVSAVDCSPNCTWNKNFDWTHDPFLMKQHIVIRNSILSGPRRSPSRWTE